jgi:hypothetical protein
MSLFARRVTARFLWATLRVWFLLSWLALVIEAPRNLARRGEWFDPDRLLITLSRFLDSAEIAFSVSAPIGMVVALLELKRSGVITVIFSAGFHHNRLRKIFLAAAACTVMVSALAQEAAVRVRLMLPADAGNMLWTVDGVKVWALDHDEYTGTLRHVYLFRNDTLDVTHARHARRSSSKDAFIISNPKVLNGKLIPLSSFRGKSADPDPFIPLSVTMLFSESVGLGDALQAINRLIAPALLLLICAWLTLLAPVSGQWIMYPAFLVLLPAAGIVVIWCSIMLWAGGLAGYAAEAVCLFGSAGIVLVLDALTNRRGLRLS